MTHDIEAGPLTDADYAAVAERYADNQIRREQEAATRYGTNVYALRLEMQRNPAWDEEAAGQAIAKRREEAAEFRKLERKVFFYAAIAACLFALWAMWWHW